MRVLPGFAGLAGCLDSDECSQGSSEGAQTGFEGGSWPGFRPGLPALRQGELCISESAASKSAFPLPPSWLLTSGHPTHPGPQRPLL